ncbi:thiaminase II [Alloscardovia criceti]|uniref:thiaminase II n=1 Tax=Alloscardovia criceti TaxID=356828 RepID=UPI0003744F51|nr:thiaminase II [Alloscardovia criceti]
MSTTQRLLTATQDIWAQYHTHPFVQGIADGSLDADKFKYYIIQDYLYLDEYLKVFALGIAKSHSIDTLSIFSHSVAALTEEEMNIHRGYLHTFNVSREALNATPRALDNLSYTSYMLRVAYEDSEAEIVAAVLSCAYSYEVIAREIVRNHPQAEQHELFGEWVRGYASDEYAAGNKPLMEAMDQLTEHYTEQQLQHVEDIFVACSRYELAFWDMAWNMRK